MKQILNKDNNRHIKRIEQTHGVAIEELLRRMFVDEHHPLPHIAETLGVSYLTVIRWLGKAGVYSRRLPLGDDSR